MATWCNSDDGVGVEVREIGGVKVSKLYITYHGLQFSSVIVDMFEYGKHCCGDSVIFRLIFVCRVGCIYDVHVLIQKMNDFFNSRGKDCLLVAISLPVT